MWTPKRSRCGLAERVTCMLTGFQGSCSVRMGLYQCIAFWRVVVNGRTMLHAEIVCFEAGAGEHARHLEVKPQAYRCRVSIERMSREPPACISFIMEESLSLL